MLACRSTVGSENSRETGAAHRRQIDDERLFKSLLAAGTSTENLSVSSQASLKFHRKLSVVLVGPRADSARQENRNMQEDELCSAERMSRVALLVSNSNELTFIWILCYICPHRQYEDLASVTLYDVLYAACYILACLTCT